MNWFRKLRYAAAAATLVGAAAASTTTASAVTIPEIMEKGTISIGVLTGLPPYDTTDSSGNTDGFLVDLAREVAKSLDVELDVVPVTNASRVAALESGRVDMLIAMTTATPQRARSLLFTNPYGSYQMTIVGPKDAEIRTLADLEGKKISVPKGSTQEATLISYNIPGLQIERFDDDALAMQALLSGQVDATAAVAVLANDLLKKRGVDDQFEVKEDLPLYTLYWSMALRADEWNLHQYLNNLIYYLEVTGVLDDLHKKWTGVPIPGGKLPTF
ncbi:transporter substrate-binding domain-containing protein [Bauldia litoralis]|uniref:Amino acid ABC transporter substrate-binding protein, PAAT family (TC 3.A.1.3.-) n=1 Tax=Bauldia litoralis TaxID=665467 RepID=A0A1G6EQ21_9HYPH|nr:transporter substrate-binding domain-containing protein [Bauldia litoralis]SDB58995.1 amino acid ABC transporter substrate-binding protein, PAAT family (TC 3.A.1.3.-) [Bauldia litoralis]